jgi:hypothetical protein
MAKMEMDDGSGGTKKCISGRIYPKRSGRIYPKRKKFGFGWRNSLSKASASSSISKLPENIGISN